MALSLSSRPLWLRLLAIALAAGGFAAWKVSTQVHSEPRTPSLPDSGLDFEPSAEQRHAISALRARLSTDNPTFAAKDARQKSNAKLFTYMAGTSAEPLVVKASLEAIQSAYSSRSSRKEAPDADLDRVLVKHLRSEEGAIAVAAFNATRIPLMTEQPRAALIVALAELAQPAEPVPRRYAALEALDLLRPTQRTAEALSAFESALSAGEPHIVSSALFALAQSGPSFAAHPASKSATLGPRVLELVAHADAGVRGRALALLTALPWLADPALVRAKVTERLGDSHPFVRAQASAALAELGQPGTIHGLMALVDDLGPAHYELTGWTALGDSPGHLVHTLPGRKRVAEAALFAVRSLSSPAAVSSSGGQGSSAPQRAHAWQPLVLTLGGSTQTKDSVQQNAELARSWYRAAQSQLPLAAAVPERGGAAE